MAVGNRFQGRTTAADLIQRLAQTMEDHGASLVAARADRASSDAGRRIREEQNANYEASLRADEDTRPACVTVDDETWDAWGDGLGLGAGDAGPPPTDGAAFLRACKGGHQGCPLATNLCTLPYFLALCLCCPRSPRTCGWGPRWTRTAPAA